MSANFENQLCYFCDETYPHPSSFISSYDDLWICHRCEDFVLPTNYKNREHDECCVCFEETSLIKLPCNHKVCLKCCKTIYFGSTTNERPIYWREMSEEQPIWPYELNDYDENDPERIKYEEYNEFEIKHFDIGKYNYDELITIRNSLITERPEWMNTEEFINYENGQFRYHTDCVILDKEWENYNESKTKGNGICPLCRAKPK